MSSSADNHTTAAGGDGEHRQHYALTFAALALAGLTFALLQSLVAPALPEIQRDLHASETETAWILTAYLLSASILTPIVGRLGDMFGKERTLVLSLVVLGAGTLVAALADSIGVLIAARVVQGCGGAIFPLAFGIIRDEFPRARVAQGIALISAILGIGGGLGIVLAGPIVDALVLPLAVLVPARAGGDRDGRDGPFVPESPVKVPGRVNVTGALLLAAWLVCLLVAISEGSTWGWSDPRTVGLFVAALVLLVAWVRNEERSAEPLVDMEMMRIRGRVDGERGGFLVGAGMYSSFVLIPLFVEMPKTTGYGFGATVTGRGSSCCPPP